MHLTIIFCGNTGELLDGEVPREKKKGGGVKKKVIL